MTTITRGDVESSISLTGYTILIHESEEGETGYWGEILEMPGCVSQGETIAELQANIQEAMDAVRNYSITSIPDYPTYFISSPATNTRTA